jgi:hypothetical protein
VAQRLELVEEVAGPGVAVDAAGVGVGAEVMEAGGGSASRGQTITRIKRAQRPGPWVCRCAGQAGERWPRKGSVLAAAVAACPSTLLRRDCPCRWRRRGGDAGVDGAGDSLAQDPSCAGGGLGPWPADLGQDALGGVAADPGDLVQAVQDRQGTASSSPGWGRRGRCGVARHRPAEAIPGGGLLGATTGAGCWGLAAVIALIVCSPSTGSWSIPPPRASIWPSSILTSTG